MYDYFIKPLNVIANKTTIWAQLWYPLSLPSFISFNRVQSTIAGVFFKFSCLITLEKIVMKEFL